MLCAYDKNLLGVTLGNLHFTTLPQHVVFTLCALPCRHLFFHLLADLFQVPSQCSLLYITEGFFPDLCTCIPKKNILTRYG